MDHAERFRERQFLTDAIIRVEHTDFPVHKIILASKSSYFEELFLQNQKQIYEINGTSQVFDLILGHIYDQPLPRLEWDQYLRIQEEMFILGIREDHPEKLLKLIQITPELFPRYLKILPEVTPDFVNYIARHLNYDFDLKDLDDELIRRLLLNKNFVIRNLIQLYQMIKLLVDSGHDPDLYNIIDYKLFPLEIYLQFSQSFLQRHESHTDTLPRLWDGNITDDEIIVLIIDPEKAQDNTGRIWEIKGITDPDFHFCDIVTLCHCTIYSEKNLIEYLLCFYF